MARLALGLCLLVSFTGCTRPNPGFDPSGTSSEDASEATTSATTSATTTPVTAAPTTGEPTTGGSISAGTGSVGSTDPGSTTEAIATTDLEATTTSTDGTSTGTTDGSESSSTGNVEPPPVEHLQLYDPGRCDVPLWCFANGDKFNGVPLRTGSQACFTPTTPPPYRLTRIGYRIAESFGDLSGGKLQIHERTDAGPGQLLHEIPVMTDQLKKGAYAQLTDKVIDVPGFCVGLVGGSKNPAAGLGVGADPQALVPKQSYLRIEDAQGVCDVPDFKDITTFEPKAPSEGAWCIDAEVVALP